MYSSTPKPFDRRRFLGSAAALGVAALGLGATGCRVQTSSTPPGSAAQAAGSVTIPDSGAKLPSSPVTIHWMSGGPGAKSEVFKALFPAYHTKHSNLTVQYDELPNNKIIEVLPLQLRNNQAPDVFQVLGVPLGELVAGKKIAALEDFVPGFEEWSARFPFGVLAPGINQFDGKTYALPTTSGKVLSSLLLYSTDQLKAADEDPNASPLTLDTFRQLANKLTKAGGGKSFGFLIGGKDGGTMGGTVLELAQLNGGTPSMNWKTGEYNFSQDPVVEVIELFKAMLSDGSFFPGWASLTEQEARAQMPIGHGAMMLQGPWNFPVWKNNFPDFSFGVAQPPSPQQHGFVTCSQVGNAYSASVNAPADHRAVIGDLFHFLGSQAGQRFWGRFDGSADPIWDPTALDELRKSSDLADHDQRAYEIFDKFTRIGPEPVLANPANQQVQLVLKPVTPGLGNIVQGYLTGQVGDLKAALRTLDSKSNSALDEAVSTAKKRGAAVAREDWAFPKWDPAKNFGKQDY